VYINDEPLSRMEVPTNIKQKLWATMVERFRRMDLDIYYETNGEHTYLIQQERNHNNWPINTRNMARIVIPEEMYFAMGDNRDASHDSRYWGFVPFNYVKGRALFVWFSLAIPLFDETNEWLLRLGRIGTTIK
jgi:signal peptidase I